MQTLRGTVSLLQPQSVAFLSSGLCGRRALDFSKIRTYLLGNGHTPVEDVNTASILFFYGCAFNNDNETASVTMLDKVIDDFSLVFCVGGITEVREDELTRIFSKRTSFHCVSIHDLSALDLWFARFTPFSAIGEENQSHLKKGYWSIQVGHGCDSNCTYCGDKRIVGPLRSKPLDAIVSEFEKGLGAGYTHFDLLGDDVGAWGRDFGDNVGSLLDSLVDYPQAFSVSLQEINIKYLIQNADTFDRILESGKIDFMVLAFQHISDRILGLMDRGYGQGGVRNLMAMLRRHNIRVHFHSILGFPSETFAELKENLKFIVEQKFATGSCFLYQARDYTLAASLPDHPDLAQKLRILNFASDYLQRHDYLVHEHFPNGKKYVAQGVLPDILRIQRA